MFLCGLGCGCLCTRNPRKRYTSNGGPFSVVLCLLLFLGGLGGGWVPGIPGRDIKPGSCFRCAVFDAVSWWFGVWLRTRNPRKRYIQGPDSDVLCLALFLGGLGCGCLPGIPGRDITRVLFQMCCVWCRSWCSWVGGV
jgi:hypothetical protein